jgi:hypothetical protein
MFNFSPKTKEIAITGCGEFSLSEKSTPVDKKYNAIDEYDVTKCVQILYNTSKINKKIGLIKVNNIIIKSSFDIHTNNFPVDTINIDANEFIEDLEPTSIISIGKLKTIYYDFYEFIHHILSNKECFNLYQQNIESAQHITPLKNSNHTEIDPLTKISVTDLNGDKNMLLMKDTYLDEHKFYSIIKEKIIFGSIQIKNINSILDNTIFFENHKNISKKNGFIQNDIICIPYGLNIELSHTIDIDKLNHFGKLYILNLKNSSDYDDGISKIDTIITENNIRRIIKIPLILKLYDKIQELDLEMLLKIQNDDFDNNNQNKNIKTNTKINTNDTNSEPVRFRHSNLHFNTNLIDFRF